MTFRPLPYDFPNVERVASASRAHIEQSERTGKPVVISGAMDDWPLLQRLNALSSDERRLESLAGLAGSARVWVTVVPRSQDGQLGYRAASTKRNFSFRSRRLTLHQLAAMFRASNSDMFYMQSAPANRFPGICAETRPLPLLAGRQSHRCRLWIGSGGQIVNLHLDPYDNFLCMLAGHKRVTLFPPEVLPDLYPAPPDRGLGGTPSSLIKLLDLDVGRLPLAKRALPAGVVARVEPGDILWIPPFWWHHVESGGLNVMLNNWVYRFDVATWHDVTVLLIAALPVLARMTQPERTRHRALLAELLAAPPAEASPIGARASPRARGLLLSMASVQRTLATEYRLVTDLFFDYFVFQVHGPPFETVPGELERAIRRCRWKRYVAPAALALFRRIALKRERFSLVPPAASA